jgi:hypothetical protein
LTQWRSLIGYSFVSQYRDRVMKISAAIMFSSPGLPPQ